MSYRLKLIFLTLLPVVLIVAAILYVFNLQSTQLKQAQARTVETVLMNMRQKELTNYVTMAKNAIGPAYTSRLKSKRQAQNEAKEIVRKLSFGDDNYFFIYSGDGTNIVNTAQPYLIGSNWIGLEDIAGKQVIKDLISNAREGGEFYQYVWQKPSSGEYVPKLGLTTYLENWDWMIGTGIYMDDIAQQANRFQNQLSGSINKTNRFVIWLTVGAVLLTGGLLTAVQVSEQRLADVRLKRLNAQIIDVQEQERKRVSQELHDGIGQLLVSSRYGLENALSKSEQSPASIEQSIQRLDESIAEVRRLSLALRPSALDDMGLAAAIDSLGRRFEEETSISVEVSTEPVLNLLSDQAKTALYRIVQEGLTNIAKHSTATTAKVNLSHTAKRVNLSIADNGIGFHASHSSKKSTSGIGLSNIQERIENFGGTVRFKRRGKGFAINVSLPVEPDVTKSSL